MKALLLLCGIVSCSLWASPQIAAGPHHFCVQDDEGEKCWVAPLHYECVFKRPKLTDYTLSQDNPCYLEEDRNSAACVAYLENESKPIAQKDLKKTEDCEVFRDDHGERVACQGQRTYFLRALRDIRQIVQTADYVCALDSAGVTCADADGGRHGGKTLRTLGRPDVLAATSTTVCGLSLGELHCWDAFHDEEYEPPADISLGNSLFQLANLDQLFNWLSEHSYHKHDPVYKAARQALSATSALFLLNALVPFEQSVDSEFFKKEVQPRFAKQVPLRNKEAGVSTLACTSETVKPAVQLLVGALRALNTDNSLDELLLAAGNALSDERALSALRAKLAQQAGVIASRPEPEASLVTALNSFLGNCFTSK